jgi:hypothetical protein
LSTGDTDLIDHSCTNLAVERARSKQYNTREKKKWWKKYQHDTKYFLALFVIFHTNGGGELKMFKPRQRNTNKLQINLKDSTRAYNMIDGIFLKQKLT